MIASPTLGSLALHSLNANLQVKVNQTCSHFLCRYKQIHWSWVHVSWPVRLSCSNVRCYCYWYLLFLCFPSLHILPVFALFSDMHASCLMHGMDKQYGKFREFLVWFDAKLWYHDTFLKRKNTECLSMCLTFAFSLRLEIKHCVCWLTHLNSHLTE